MPNPGNTNQEQVVPCDRGYFDIFEQERGYVCEGITKEKVQDKINRACHIALPIYVLEHCRVIDILTPKRRVMVEQAKEFTVDWKDRVDIDIETHGSKYTVYVRHEGRLAQMTIKELWDLEDIPRALERLTKIIRNYLGASDEPVGATESDSTGIPG